MRISRTHRDSGHPEARQGYAVVAFSSFLRTSMTDQLKEEPCPALIARTANAQRDLADTQPSVLRSEATSEGVT